MQSLSQREYDDILSDTVDIPTQWRSQRMLTGTCLCRYPAEFTAY